jgi:phage terminase large subunit-like protein
VKLTKRQNQVLAEIAGKRRILLYGGSRAGKSWLIMFLIVLRALKVKSRHMVLRKHFAHVKQSIVFDTFPALMRGFFEGMTYTLDKTHWFAEFENGSQIWFGGLDDKERTEKILGNEYSSIFFNECSQIADYATIMTGLTRLAENTKLPRVAFFDENPPSKRHWSYSVFIEGKLPKGETIANRDIYYHARLNPPDNEDNLPPDYINDTLATLPKKQRERFLEGKFQDDNEGALWSTEMITYGEPLSLVRVVIAIDPAVTSDPDSDETGIVVVGEDAVGGYWVLDDLSGIYTPVQMAHKVRIAYDRHKADRVIGEVNNGGDLVEAVLRNEMPNVPYTAVRASRGKFTRAEPISGLYERLRVKHSREFKELEDQMLSWSAKKGEKSPDRVDALVWGLSFLSNDDTDDLIYA